MAHNGNDAEVAAEAALGACEDAILYLEKEVAAAANRSPDLDAALPYWRRRATFFAAQVIAGNCHRTA